MDCSNCEQVRKDFLCVSCISKEFREYQTTLTHLASERDLLVAKASASITHLSATRGRRADVAALRSKLDDIQLHTRQLREDSDAARERIVTRRAALATRKQVVEEAYRLNTGSSNTPPRTPTPTPPGGPPRRKLPSPSRIAQDTTSARIVELEASLHTLKDSLARARQGLVQELVDVFAVVEVGGRPAAGVRAATRGAWSIGGLVLPVPGDMRRVPPAHANAALTFTLHFIGLLTFYLGVRLPFEVGWSGGKLGVGIPEIWATKGEDRGGWARWSARCPLHLPLSPSTTTTDMPNTTSTSTPPFPSSSPPQLSGMSPYPSQMGNIPSRTQRRDSLNSSQTLSPSHPSTATSFSTALAMLSYNTAYLAQTQGVDVSLSSAASGQLLATLWAVCCSADLGMMSHATRPMLAPPASAMDFRQLLQAQAIASGAGPVSVATGSSPSAKKERKSKGRMTIDVVAEEEDGWEVIDEAG